MGALGRHIPIPIQKGASRSVNRTPSSVPDIHIELTNIMSKKIIAVIGATGKQGGGMIDALLKDGTFAVRAITRDTNSDKAKGRSTNNQMCINNLPNFPLLVQPSLIAE